MYANIQDYLLHRLKLLSMHRLHQRAKKRFLKKLPLSKLCLLAHSFINESLPSMINHKVVKRLELSKDKGYTLLLSSSPSFIVEPIALILGITHWRATTWDPFVVLDGTTKLKMTKDFASHWNVPLNQCTAYSDSYLDLPLLSSVGTPVLVNPDRTLRTINLKNNWEII
jgi:phosphoserine phosphatase